MQVRLLVLQAAPQPLDEHVVQPAASAVHANACAGVVEHIGKCGAGELTALVGVEDLKGF